MNRPRTCGPWGERGYKLDAGKFGLKELWRGCYSDHHLSRGGNSAVECQLPKLDVAGSIPVPRSIVVISLTKAFHRLTR